MLKNMSLLYVEDDVETNRLMSMILETQVSSFYSACDGEDGLSKYEQYKPDIVITDIQMPKMNGLDMIREIKKIDSDQIVLISSAFNDINYLREAIELQVSGYILKPVTKEMLFSELGKVAQMIDERKESQNNKHLYEQYYNTTNDIYISVDVKTGMIVNTNESAQKRFGYTKDEFENIHISTIHADNNDDATLDKAIKNDILKGKEVIFEKFSYITKSGEVFFANVKIYPIENRFGEVIISHAIINDLTDELLLEYNKKYLENIFEASHDFIITTFGKKIDKANDSLFHFLGYKDIDAFLKEHDCICDFFKEEDGYVTKDMNGKTWVEYILENKDVYHKVKIVRDDKEYIFGVTVKIFEFDKYERYIVFLTDITSLEMQYETIKEQEELLMLQSKQAAIGEVMGMVAHQWKQPLSILSMIANNQLMDIALQEDVSIDELKNSAVEMLTQVNYLSNTIDNFRDFLKPNRTAQKENISEVMEHIRTIIAKSLENNGVSLFVDIQDDMLLNTYTKELAQIIINILNNSKDAYVDSEEIKIEKPIFVTIFEEGKNGVILIADNAGGIAEDILARIYEPYFTTKGSDKGTGIGLYMVKNILKKYLKGSVETVNKDGGVQTKITFPKILQKESQK